MSKNTQLAAIERAAGACLSVTVNCVSLHIYMFVHCNGISHPVLQCDREAGQNAVMHVYSPAVLLAVLLDYSCAS
jgi:hypothetical protein